MVGVGFGQLVLVAIALDELYGDWRQNTVLRSCPFVAYLQLPKDGLQIIGLSVGVFILNHIEILEYLLGDLDGRRDGEVLLFEGLLEVAPLGLYAVFKLLSRAEDVDVDVVEPAVAHHQVQVFLQLCGVNVLAVPQFFDHGRQIDGLLDLLVIVRQRHRVHWLTEDLGELLLDQSKEHQQKFLLQAVLWLHLAHAIINYANAGN